MEYYVLASGSKGNCTVVKSKDTMIMIDFGITQKYLKDSFEEIRLDYQDLDGVLITHAHSDHLNNTGFIKNLDVYSPFKISGLNRNHLIKPLDVFTVKDLDILAIPLSHDTEITVGYVIFDGQETLVIVTDTGYLSDRNIRIIRNANYYIMESNHDPEMLLNTTRPKYIKNRIVSDCGHLSNEDCGYALSECINEDTKEIVLAHISQEANTIELAYETVIEILAKKGIDHQNIKITAAKQFEIYQGGSK
ncbi:MAG TPA: MBL fold metallo-hydrolase [Erysipelotrichaceae bacterium]|nr:MBL fold metallo-hydrolase [Erysipelotrichaceae bacterium]HQB32586.1 MBL fold metallo-hydrolase [Erysipelotrichaceae bacterium]